MKVCKVIDGLYYIFFRCKQYLIVFYENNFLQNTEADECYLNRNDC